MAESEVNTTVEDNLEWRGAKNEKIRYVKLGSSNFMVSDLCMGTMTFGSFTNEEESFAILDRYVELGGNFIDTAEAYPVPINPNTIGVTESLVGKWLASREGMREKVFLATKHSGPSSDNFRKKRLATLGREIGDDLPNESFTLNEYYLRLGVEASLARLQTDSIDLYQIHWPDRYTPLWGSSVFKEDLMNRHQHFPTQDRPRLDMDEVVKVLGKLIEEGKIRSWGLSNETTYGVCSWCEAAVRQGVPKPISIQNDFSLLDRRFESELAEACCRANHDLGLLCYGALCGGFLTDKYLNNTALPTARHKKHPNFQKRYQANIDVVKQYQDLSQKHGISVAKLAQAWARTRFYMGSVIIGATSIAQLEENMECGNLELSEECLEAIDDIHLANKNPNIDVKFKQKPTLSLLAKKEEAGKSEE